MLREAAAPWLLSRRTLDSSERVNILSVGWPVAGSSGVMGVQGPVLRESCGRARMESSAIAMGRGCCCCSLFEVLVDFFQMTAAGKTATELRWSRPHIYTELGRYVPLHLQLDIQTASIQISWDSRQQTTSLDNFEPPHPSFCSPAPSTDPKFSPRHLYHRREPPSEA
jgi:hypothetical protein